MLEDFSIRVYPNQSLTHEEVVFFLKNRILCSDRITKKFIALKKKTILNGLFRNCITRGSKWKQAFQTKEEANTFVEKRFGKDKAYSYKCELHGYHISCIDESTYRRGYLKREEETR